MLSTKQPITTRIPPACRIVRRLQPRALACMIRGRHDRHTQTTGFNRAAVNGPQTAIGIDGYDPMTEHAHTDGDALAPPAFFYYFALCPRFTQLVIVAFAFYAVHTAIDSLVSTSYGDQ